jgi:hypothetical protein
MGSIARSDAEYSGVRCQTATSNLQEGLDESVVDAASCTHAVTLHCKTNELHHAFRRIAIPLLILSRS